jgi:hypothetical protein
MYTGGLRGWKQLSLATAGYVGQERTQAAHRKEPQDPAINLFLRSMRSFAAILISVLSV